MDGDLWAYLDTGPGGSAVPVGFPNPPGLLPFDADYAIQVDSVTSGTLWHYDNIWLAGPLEFAHGESGGTEVRLPLETAAVSNLQLISFALDNAGQVWSIFPTTNPLNPSGSAKFTGMSHIPMQAAWTDAYQWADLTTITRPNEGQPTADSVLMALSSPQAAEAHWGPGDDLAYAVNLTNREAHEVLGLQLAFSATLGLTYQTVEGATCADCTNGDYWLLDIPPLPAGETHVVTVTGQLDADLSGLADVTTEVDLTFGGAVYAQAELSHLVEGSRPWWRSSCPRAGRWPPARNVSPAPPATAAESA